jgi:hypothetical protein
MQNSTCNITVIYKNRRKDKKILFFFKFRLVKFWFLLPGGFILIQPEAEACLTLVCETKLLMKGSYE